MRMIISPAKKMRRNTDVLDYHQLPVFLHQAEELKEYLQGLSFEEAKKLWKCSDRLAEQNYQRLKDMDLHRGLTPAILSYEGIQYQYMAPLVLEESALRYVEEHLRILSGFYGLLRPFDGVVPYRLEMQAGIDLEGCHSLYDYWGSQIADCLLKETDCVLNLASKEYSRSISTCRKEGIRFITCVFGEYQDGKVREKGTLCKMARGEMVRFMAERQIRHPEEVKEFTGLGYQFQEKLSDERTYVFVKQIPGQPE